MTYEYSLVVGLEVLIECKKDISWALSWAAVNFI